MQGQSSVFVNGKLWSVEGDPETHGNGQLVASHSSVTINGKKVIVNTPDTAAADNAPHSPPLTNTAQGSPNVFGYS